MTLMPSSLEIAQRATLRPIAEVAEEIGLLPDEVELFGRYKAKIRLEALERLAGLPDGREVIVTAITPTPLGEGKTTTTIGLAQGLRRLGPPGRGHDPPALARTRSSVSRAAAPVVGTARSSRWRTSTSISPATSMRSALRTTWRRPSSTATCCKATSWRSTWPRSAGRASSTSTTEPCVGSAWTSAWPADRETEFHITAASEVMAILALADDLADLRLRLGRAIVAEDDADRAVTLEDLRVAGAMTVVLRDAIKPNLVQTIEGGPAFVHAGPFANIAHGNSSVVADRIALKLTDVVCTEGGFAADMGFQKFVDIKCRLSGLRPSAAVIVATIRALKMHGGVGTVVAGKPLDPAILAEDPEAVRRGAANLRQHLAIVPGYGIPAVVALNAFPTDHPRRSRRARGGARGRSRGHRPCAPLQRGWRRCRGACAGRVVGGPGRRPRLPLPLPPGAPLREQIEDIATRVYGADGVDYSPTATAAFDAIERLGFGGLPVCMAKTQSSLSHDPALKGRPRGIPTAHPRRAAVRRRRLRDGLLRRHDDDARPARRPAGEGVDIDASGRIVGLF